MLANLPETFRRSPLRVQFVTTSLPVGGAETLLLNLIRGLDRQVCEPEVVCLKEPGELGHEIAGEVPLHANLLQSKWDVSILWKLKRLFQDRQADAVVTVGAGDKMFWGRLAAKLAGTPAICSALHSTGWPDGVGRLNRWLTRWTHGFIACAEGHANHLVQGEGFPSAKVFMIPNGVDTDRFRPNGRRRAALRRELGIGANCPVVGIVAALRSEKNHLQFVAAARQVLARFPQTHFVIVGDGPERSQIEAAIRQQQLESQFHLLGCRQDTPELLAGLDVFCLTSKNEANPVSILEALSCGIPVVSPNVGSVRETVLPNTTGILTEPLSETSTAEAIVRLLDNPTFASHMGLAGRQLVRQHWSLEAMISGYQKLLVGLYNAYAARSGQPRWFNDTADSENSASELSNEADGPSELPLALPAGLAVEASGGCSASLIA